MLVCNPCGQKLGAEEELNRREKLVETIVPARFREARLEHLSKPLRAKINALADDKGLLLWGQPGVGKSYAMAALARRYILTGSTVDRVGYEMLCLQIRDTFKAGSTQGELDVIRPLFGVAKLFIEDVGTTVSAGHQESDFSLRTFLVLLDKRLEACKPTFITTNKSVEQLSKSFDRRIASRLQQACEIIQLTGEDRRAAK